MADHHDHERPTAGERVRHWLVVTSLTFLGLLVAELPVLSQTRDRVYLWLQERLVRSHKTVVVVAIDDEEFWRGELRGKSPLQREYLARLLRKVARANPAAIGLDVGLEVNAPDVRPQWNLLTDDEKTFLSTVDAVAKICPMILPRTISGNDQLVRRYDLFDAIKFSNDAVVAYGHTSSARDPRQIPTRVLVDDDLLLDSFAVAVFRAVTREVPAKLDDPNHAWPYSFFLPTSTFVPKKAPMGRDGLLTARALLAATPAQAKSWLERQVVLIGGTWRVAPHPGSELADAHRTPAGTLPGVVVHANYVQSLLWDAMYAMPRPWRLAFEIVLALAISVGFLIAHGWRRLVLVISTLIIVVLLTWVFSSAIGVFFDMVVPVAFLGVHALWEQSSAELRLDFRRKFRYAGHVFSGVVVAAVVTSGFLFVRHEINANEKQLAVEDRLQVTDLEPPPRPDGDAQQEISAQKSPEAEKMAPRLAPPQPRPEERTAQKVPLDEPPRPRQRRIVEQLSRQVEDQALALRSLEERERLSEATIASQIEAEQGKLASERSEGRLTPEVLAQREQQIAGQREELQRLQREREETARLRAQAESARATAIAEEERRRSEAEAQTAQLRPQIAEQQARVTQSEAELARRDETVRARIEAMQAELSKLSQTRNDERGFIVTLPGLFFDSGKAVLKPGARNTLTMIAYQLRLNPDTHIEIEGHTDSVGSESMNQALSEKRALAVRDFLASRGLPSVRITVTAQGESTPVASNDTPSGRQQNRRVELVIAPTPQVTSQH